MVAECEIHWKIWERERRATHHRRAVTDVVTLCVFKTNWIFLFGFIIPSYEEKRRESVSQSVTDLNIFLLTPSRSLSPSVSIAWLLHVKLSLSLVKTRTTTPLVFRFPSLLLVSSVFGDGDDRPGVSRIFVTFLPPSLSCVCVCVCAYIFFWSGPTHRDWPWWIILRQ